MALSQIQQITFQEWINKHNPNYICPFCGGDTFSSSDIIASQTLEQNIKLKVEIMPFVPLICNKCAHVTLFSSFLIGL